MNKHSLPTAFAVAALLTGCTLEPHYDRPAAPVATTYPTGPAYRQPATKADELPAPEIGWQNFFADAQLKRLVDLALRNNRDLRVAALNVERARAQFQIQRAGLFPSVSGLVTDSRSRTPADLSFFNTPLVSSTYEVGLSASWEIDLFGRLRSLKDAALAQYFATAEARKATQIALVSQVADQYLVMRAYDEQLAVTQSTLRVANESYRIAKLQFDTGTGSELELRQAEGVVQQAKANFSDQTRLRAQSENALVLLVGQPLPADLPPSQPLHDQGILTDLPEGLPSALLTRRPDIAQAEETLLAANADIGAARAAFFPRISLTGSFGTASRQLSGLFKAGSAIWSFAPQLTVPIFEAGLNVANLEAAKVSKEIAVAQYEKAIQSAFREVADGLAARGTYDDEIKSLERYVFTQQRRLDLSELRYRNGVDSYLNVLTAQDALYGAQQSLVTARLARLTNLVDLYRSLGGGWVEHTGDAPRPADVAYAVPASNGTSAR